MNSKEFIEKILEQKADEFFKKDKVELTEVLQELCYKYLAYYPAMSQNVGELLDVFRKTSTVNDLQISTKQKLYFDQALKDIIKESNR